MKWLFYYVTAALILIAAPALADTVDFDRDTAGAPPAGWKCGATGRGAPRWAVEVDASAPSKPNVLKQSGNATFPWCAKTELADSSDAIVRACRSADRRAMWRIFR